MVIVPWFLITSIAAVMPVAARPQLKFEPQEKITTGSLERLEVALEWQVREFVPGPHPADPIKQIAVDGQQGILYLHCQRWGYGLEKSKPAGIFAYNMHTGEQIRHIRVPARLDMSGSSRNASGRCIFDFENRAAWYACGLEETNVVLRLDLEKDQPRVVARDLVFADEPRTGDGRLLLVTPRRWRQAREVSWFDPATERLDNPVELPIDVEWTWIGAAGKHVVGLSQPYPEDNGGPDRRKPARWQVLKADDQRIVSLASRLSDLDKVKPGPRGAADNFALDSVDGRLLILSAPFEHRDAVKRPLTVCEIPTLETICEGGAFFWTRFVPVAKTPCIMLLRGPSSPEVLFLAEKDCKVRRRLNFASTQVSQAGESWTPFSDASGLFVGVYGARGVVLFAVRPPGQEGQ